MRIRQILTSAISPDSSGRGFLTLVFALQVAAVFAAGQPHTGGRRLPIYYPGETAVFGVGAEDYEIADENLETVARGRGAEVPHAALGGKFGAFRFTSGTATNWFAFLPSREVKPCPWVGTVTHPSFGWAFGNLIAVEAMAAGGYGIVREFNRWSSREQKKGVFTRDPNYDAYLGALRERGIRTIQLLVWGNKIYENPIDPEAYANYCAWSVKTYGKDVAYFELWNEARNFEFRKVYGDKQWLAKFVETTCVAKKAMRAVDPDVRIGVASEDMEGDLLRMVERGIADERDVITFHPYSHKQHRPERDYFFRDYGARLKDYALRHGGAHRWGITEVGWTTYQGAGQYWDVAGSYPRASYAGQADCLVRMYLSARAAGVEFVCQHHLRDFGSRRPYTEHNFGVLFEDYSPKPAFAAVAALTRLIGQAQYAGRLEDDSSRYRVIAFKAGDRRVLGCWSVAGDFVWRVPAAAAEATVIDLYGNRLGRLPSRNLTLVERPVYLEFPSGR